MRSYQSVLILKPDLDEAQVDENLEKISEFIQGSGGACLKVDKWGKKRLAYKVKKSRFGIYLNIYHTCENDKVGVLENRYKLFDAIIKYMVVRVEDKDLERALGDDESEEAPLKESGAGNEEAGKEKAAAVKADDSNDKDKDKEEGE